MRCPNCEKFVSYDEPEVEIEEGEISEAGENKFKADAQVRIVLKCAECGEELKEANEDIEIEFEHKCTESDFAVEELSLNDVSGEGYSRVETSDKRGKKIKNPRYMKTYYGAEVTFDIGCGLCGEDLVGSEKVECQASAFDELV